MRKITWMLSVLAVMLLTSCMENEGYTYSGTFCRIVTIDHSVQPIRFYCDYTGEVIECQNINTESDLVQYGLSNIDRALASFSYQSDINETIVTLNDGCAPIEVGDLWCDNLPKDQPFNPVYGFNQLQVESGWSYPYAWVSRGYLNVIPVTKANASATPYLAPAGANGDTLKFNLYMSYELGSNYRAEYACFDLTQLADTARAAAQFRPWMKEMTDLIHNRDSVMVCIWADYMHSDTALVSKVTVPTGYFRLNIN